MKKQCTKCGEWKELEEFTKNKSCKMGRSGTCLNCKNVYRREWAEENPDKLWRNKYPEKYRAYIKRILKKYRDILSDDYIKKQLRERLSIERYKITPQMIQLKREQIMVRRALQSLKEAINE